MMKDDTYKWFIFFFTLANCFICRITLMLTVIIFLCRDSGEQMCLLIFFFFFLRRQNLCGSLFCFLGFFTALITCFAMLWPIFKVKLEINTCFGERGTTMFLRRLGPVRQQSSFQLDIKMQIIQTSKYVKVRVERTLIHSEIKLESLSTLIVLG